MTQILKKWQNVNLPQVKRSANGDVLGLVQVGESFNCVVSTVFLASWVKVNQCTATIYIEKEAVVVRNIDNYNSWR